MSISWINVETINLSWPLSIGQPKCPINSMASTNSSSVFEGIVVLRRDPKFEVFLLLTHLDKVEHGMPVVWATFLNDSPPLFTSNTALCISDSAKSCCLLIIMRHFLISTENESYSIAIFKHMKGRPFQDMKGRPILRHHKHFKWFKMNTCINV